MDLTCYSGFEELAIELETDYHGFDSNSRKSDSNSCYSGLEKLAIEL